MIQIQNVTEATKDKIKRSSAFSLPHNPTGAGYKPQDIKNALFKPIVDGQNSVLAEIERLIDQINAILQKSLGTSISLSVDESNYKITMQLKADDGDVLSSQEIDLPLESVVVNGRYLDGKIIWILKNGNTFETDISDIVRGLVNTDEFDNRLSDKLDRQGYTNIIYATDYYGNDQWLSYGNGIYNSIPERISSGDIIVPTEPTSEECAASKAYVDKMAGQGGGNITVEQEVNDSTNPVSSKAVKNEFIGLVEYYDNVINEAVVRQEYFYDSDTISNAALDVAHNRDYHSGDDISNLLIRIPSGNILCSVMFKIVDSGDFNIEIMGHSGYIGKAPDFKNGETWELNIHNGIIASGKVVSE